MSEKTTSLIPEDADEILLQLAKMRKEIATKFSVGFGAGINNGSHANSQMVSAFSNAVQAELELRRQMVLEEQRKQGQSAPRIHKKPLNLSG